MKSQWCYGHIPFAWEYLLFCWLFESLWCLLSWPILISCPLLPVGIFCHCMPTCFIFSFHTDQSCLLGKPDKMKPPGLFQLIWTAAKARATLSQGLSFKNLAKNRTLNYYLFPEGISASSYGWILWRLTPSNSSPKLWFGFTHVSEAVFLQQKKRPPMVLNLAWLNVWLWSLWKGPGVKQISRKSTFFFFHFRIDLSEMEMFL